MIKFLKNTLGFVLLFYAILLLLILGSTYIIKKNADFKLPSHINKIIVGHSQPECAFNDSLISNFKNLSKSAETYFYGYAKLKQVLKQNPQIDIVYIEFSAVNIFIREDEKIWTDRYIQHQLPTYFSFLDPTDHWLLMQKNTMGYHHSTLKSMLGHFGRIANNQYNYNDSIGGYQYLSRQNTKELADAKGSKKNKPITLSSDAISTYDITYLKKMIALCREKNIKVYLVRSPNHPNFIGNAYEDSFIQFKQDHFNEIPFLDFKDFALTDADFADLQHLNYRGAAKFSKWFNTLLSNQPY